MRHRIHSRYPARVFFLLPGAILGGLMAAGCAGERDTPRVSPEFTESAAMVLPEGQPNFTSRAEGYSLWLPGPAEKKTLRTTMSGVGEVEVSAVAASAGSLTCLVVPAPLPPGQRGHDAADFLEGAVAGLVKPVPARVEKSRNILLDKHPGREVEVSIGPGLKSLNRLYYTGPYLYQISVLGPGAELQRRRTLAFKILDSFRVLDTAPAG